MCVMVQHDKALPKPNAPHTFSQTKTSKISDCQLVCLILSPQEQTSKV